MNHTLRTYILLQHFRWFNFHLIFPHLSFPTQPRAPHSNAARPWRFSFVAFSSSILFEQWKTMTIHLRPQERRYLTKLATKFATVMKLNRVGISYTHTTSLTNKADGCHVEELLSELQRDCPPPYSAWLQSLNALIKHLHCEVFQNRIQMLLCWFDAQRSVMILPFQKIFCVNVFLYKA